MGAAAVGVPVVAAGVRVVALEAAGPAVPVAVEAAGPAVPAAAAASR
ncbi:MAG TPA: hypothetical protein VGR49_02890 [Actinomycetota bacterium]|nr:hypothetical protein [Actinomycetota bacterium]